MLNTALKTKINNLSFQDKLEVFEMIRESVMPSSESGFPELSDAQMQVLLSRAERAAASPSTGYTWAEVRQRIEE